MALAGTRSKHNTYMSVPLVWTMVNMHTAAAAPANIWAQVAFLLAAMPTALVATIVQFL